MTGKMPTWMSTGYLQSYDLRVANPEGFHQYVRALEGLDPGITYLAELLDHPEYELGPEPPRGFVLKVIQDHSVRAGFVYNFTEDSTIDEKNTRTFVSEALRENALCTYICIQGINPNLIEHLGSALDIPPEFFAKHVIADSWDSTATYLGNSNLEYPYWVSENVPALDSEKPDVPYFQLRYPDLRPVGGVEINEDAEKDLTPAGPGKSCKHEFVETKRQVTVWSGQKNCGWICVVLYEPHYTNKKDKILGPPIYRSFLPMPHEASEAKQNTYYTGKVMKKWLHQNHRQGPIFCPRCRQHTFKTRNSFGQSLRFYMEQVCLDESSLRLIPASPLMMLAPVYMIVASQWMVMLQWIARTVQDHEHRLDCRGDAHSLDHLNRMMKVSFWRRKWLALYQRLIAETIPECSRLKGSQAAAGIAKQIKRDFRNLDTSMKQLERRLERNLDLIKDLINIRIAQQGAALNRYAAVFVPLSAMLSLFSMSNEYGINGKQTDVMLKWTLGTTAVLALLLMVVPNFWYNIGFSIVHGWIKRICRYVWSCSRNTSVDLYLKCIDRNVGKDKKIPREVRLNKMRQGRLTHMKTEPFTVCGTLQV